MSSTKAFLAANLPANRAGLARARSRQRIACFPPDKLVEYGKSSQIFILLPAEKTKDHMTGRHG